MSPISELDRRLKEISDDVEEYNALKKHINTWLNGGGNLATMPAKAQQAIQEVIEGQRKT